MSFRIYVSIFKFYEIAIYQSFFITIKISFYKCPVMLNVFSLVSLNAVYMFAF